MIQKAVAAKQPVVIKFTADWCTNCVVVEKHVYHDTQVVNLLKEKNVLIVKPTRPPKICRHGRFDGPLWRIGNRTRHHYSIARRSANQTARHLRQTGIDRDITKTAPGLVTYFLK